MMKKIFLLLVCSIMFCSLYAEETELIRLLKENKVEEAKTLLCDKIGEHKDPASPAQFRALISILKLGVGQIQGTEGDPFFSTESWETLTNEFMIAEIKDYVNQQDKARRTALHYAAALLDIDLVLMLIGLGATRGVRNKCHNTPAHYAIKKCPEYTGDQSHKEYIANFAPKLISVLRIILHNKKHAWDKTHCNLQNKNGETVAHLLIQHSIGAYVLVGLVNAGMPLDIENLVSVIKDQRKQLKEEYGKVGYYKISNSMALSGHIAKAQEGIDNRVVRNIEAVTAQLRNLYTNQD